MYRNGNDGELNNIAGAVDYDVETCEILGQVIGLSKKTGTQALIRPSPNQKADPKCRFM